MSQLLIALCTCMATNERVINSQVHTMERYVRMQIRIIFWIRRLALDIFAGMIQKQLDKLREI